MIQQKYLKFLSTNDSKLIPSIYGHNTIHGGHRRVEIMYVHEIIINAFRVVLLKFVGMFSECFKFFYYTVEVKVFTVYAWYKIDVIRYMK